ncbi:hypothetical protein Ddye_006105 [Dipteronia dyeriana]|uniref:Uncharacterized protein n=1 Tax=Dipteronia dyeriana TaxID=168575 RepID=A0AAD9XHR0_9ROSI|nr:hypothetical protein Ddye_006105 [Dipteronia dyeriana]
MGHVFDLAHSLIDEPKVVEQLRWCNEEAAMFDYTADKDGKDTESDERDGVQSEEQRESVSDEGNNGVGVGVEVNEGLFIEVNMGLNNVADLDGVQSKEDVESDGDGGNNDVNEGVDVNEGGEDNGVQTGEGVQKGVGIDGDHIDGDDEITKQCQTFGNKEGMRGIFKEYAIRKDGCPWRAHDSRTIDKKSFIIKTLDDKHECHRVYNNSEAKVKWIVSKVESFVKRNPIVSIKLLGDLLLEKYNIAVDMKKLYNVKYRLMSQLMSDHNNFFKYLRQYAYTLNQTNPRTTIHIKIQKPLSTFCRLPLSFLAQKQGFLEGCRPSIGLD